MKKMFYTLGLLFVTVTAFASVKFFSFSNADLDHQNYIKCGSWIDCSSVSGQMVMKNSAGTIASSPVFASGDATPSIAAAAPVFKTFPNNAVIITGFTGGFQGQEFLLLAQGAASLDVTSSNIICGSTDIGLASGDLTRFVYDGAVSRCQTRIKQSTAY